MNENETTLMPSEENAKGTEDTEAAQTAENEKATLSESLQEEFEDLSPMLSHPMFAHFARGRRGDIEAICHDFKAMLSSLPEAENGSLASKMTPRAYYAAPDVALTERQRAIARAAGMSYREYYAMIGDIPHKK